MPSALSIPRAYNGAPRTHGTETIIKKLSEFGLSEKEAQLYVHLLKYGPKRAGDLARSLKTYRLEVYRKLTNLVDKAVVRAKKESPAVYMAVGLDQALDGVLLARQRELRWMEEIKKELLELANGTQPLLPDDTPPSETLAIDDDRACIQLLSAFGLSEKEAQLYVHLLKYGPKRAGDLARSLKTYREDVYRRCARLIDDGMVAKSTEDSSRYSPVELDEALDAALSAHQRDLRRLQGVKQELVEDANSTLGRGVGNARSFKMLKTVGEVVSAISQLINAAETSVVFVAHPGFDLLSMGGFLDHLSCAIERDVIVRGVLDISPRNRSAAREYLDCSVEVRHMYQYRGMTMVMADGTRSVSLIHTDLKTALSLDENVAALWSDNVAQAEFLRSAFEMAWEQATGAEERIDQLLQPEYPSLKSAQPLTRTLTMR